MESKGNIFNIDRQEFILELFRSISNEYYYIQHQECLRFCGSFAKYLFHVYNEIDYKMPDTTQVEMIIQDETSVFKFIAICRNYGKIEIEKIHSNNTKCIRGTLTFKLENTGLILFSNSISRFIFDKILRQYGENLSIEFCIYQNEPEYPFLSDRLVAEYYPAIPLYVFSGNKTRSTISVLDSIIYNMIYHIEIVKRKIDLESGNIPTNTERYLEMIRSNNDSFVYPLLVPKTTPVETKELCSICQEDVSTECYKTSCGHVFHFHCICEFLLPYYTRLRHSAISSTLYDLEGNMVVPGSDYYKCPNCKSECFYIQTHIQSGVIKIRDPENSIFCL